MFQLLPVSSSEEVRRQRDKPLVAIAILSRGRLGYLKKCIEGIKRGKTSLCNTYIMLWDNGSDPETQQWIYEQYPQFINWLHLNDHNAGQHVAMNRMIDKASRIRADWFIRIDEDCVFETKKWLSSMLRLQKKHKERTGIYCILSPKVGGLKAPPPPLADIKIGKYHCDVVSILGGICRMSPMALMRYWRFDERMAMGYSEATTFSVFCKMNKMPFLRFKDVIVNHGGSTEKQEADDPDWAYEHNILQYVPYGL